jgi:hypothetical protein
MKSSKLEIELQSMIHHDVHFCIQESQRIVETWFLRKPVSHTPHAVKTTNTEL